MRIDDFTSIRWAVYRHKHDGNVEFRTLNVRCWGIDREEACLYPTEEDANGIALDFAKWNPEFTYCIIKVKIDYTPQPDEITVVSLKK